ncbi:hypothetical protein TIFTF001_016667 [Ficus carica]|uniref:Uncharacterized protein n=1 Tax=Ficus carica TaxID=3494 RepID=A0AA88AJY1_FICCA|nr:hypothetical protein TIFTF001_016667 [Ficus carica]
MVGFRDMGRIRDSRTCFEVGFQGRGQGRVSRWGSGSESKVESGFKTGVGLGLGFQDRGQGGVLRWIWSQVLGRRSELGFRVRIRFQDGGSGSGFGTRVVVRVGFRDGVRGRNSGCGSRSGFEMGIEVEFRVADPTLTHVTKPDHNHET